MGVEIYLCCSVQDKPCKLVLPCLFHLPPINLYGCLFPLLALPVEGPVLGFTWEAPEIVNWHARRQKCLGCRSGRGCSSHRWVIFPRKADMWCHNYFFDGIFFLIWFWIVLNTGFWEDSFAWSNYGKSWPFVFSTFCAWMLMLGFLFLFLLWLGTSG